MLHSFFNRLWNLFLINVYLYDEVNVCVLLCCNNPRMHFGEFMSKEPWTMSCEVEGCLFKANSQPRV